MAPGDSPSSVPAYAEQLAWLESLEAAAPGEGRGPRLAARGWKALWPMVLAVAIVLGVWELIALSGWKKLIFPAPGPTLANLWDELHTAELWHAIAVTGLRAVIGFGLAVVIGSGIGALVSPIRPPDPAAASRGRLAADRAADLAVDCLVPVCHHPVRYQHHHHLVRHHLGR